MRVHLERWKASSEARKSAILKLQYPSTIRQLRKFIGFVNYVKHFATNMQHYLRPFYRMLKKGVKLEDTPQLRELFQRLKTHLAQARISIFSIQICLSLYVQIAQ